MLVSALTVRERAGNLARTATYVRFGTLITYAFIYGWTPWLEQSAWLSAADAGLLLPSFTVATVASALAARHHHTWPWPVAGATALAVGSAGLLPTARSPLSRLLAVSVVFGAQNGLNIVANQAAMDAQTPADPASTAAGMLRAFMYLGAVATTSLISLSLGHNTGLHRLAVILTIGAATLLAASLAGQKLAAARPHTR